MQISIGYCLIYIKRERDRDRETERDSDRERETERDRERQRERDNVCIYVYVCVFKMNMHFLKYFPHYQLSFQYYNYAFYKFAIIYSPKKQLEKQ